MFENLQNRKILSETKSLLLALYGWEKKVFCFSFH